MSQGLKYAKDLSLLMLLIKIRSRHGGLGQAMAFARRKADLNCCIYYIFHHAPLNLTSETHNLGFCRLGTSGIRTFKGPYIENPLKI